MDIGIFISIGIAIAIVGFMVGASSVVSQKRSTPTSRPQRTTPSPNAQRPSRRQILPRLLLLLGFSILMLVMGFQMVNIVPAAVGFLCLFVSFGLLGAFFFNEIY